MSQIKVTLRRLARSVSEPKVPYLILRNWTKMLKRRKFGALYGSIFETILTPGSNPYFQQLRESHDDGLVRSEILGFEMYLDAHDEGLSRTLLQFGIREQRSSAVFCSELRRLKGELDGEITVLDIGANIGYYTLIEATILGDRAQVYAIEPVSRNIDILRKNVELNGLTDTVSLHQLALGNENKEADFYLAEESNWHSFHRTRAHEDLVQVDMKTVDRFLTEQGVSPESINVVRTDVEGFEVELFESLDAVLASGTPLVVFVELHPSFRDADELNRILDQLEAYGFEIVSTVLDKYGNRFDQGWSGERVTFDSFDEIRDHHRSSAVAVELVARRG